MSLLFTRRRALLGASSLLVPRVAAAPWQPNSVVPFIPSYSGPGNIASFTAWYGTRAYTAAIAAAHSALINLRRGSDNATSDFNALSNGDVDQAAALTFAGVDATGTGAITGTALTFTGGNIGDTVTGGTTAPGTFIVSGSSPTWTVNISQTVASTTLTLTWGLFVTTLYDQTGGGNPIAQTTSFNQPLFVPNLVNGRGVVVSNGAAQSLVTAGGFTPATGLISFTGVGQRASGTGGAGLIRANGSSGNRIAWPGVANSMRMTGAGGGSVSVSATDAVTHAAFGVLNGASSALFVDAATNTGTATGDTTANQISAAAGAVSTILYFGESGFADNVDLTSSGAALLANEKAWWNTP